MSLVVTATPSPRPDAAGLLEYHYRVNTCPEVQDVDEGVSTYERRTALHQFNSTI